MSVTDCQVCGGTHFGSNTCPFGEFSMQNKENLMTWKPEICVYHGGCDDGFGAALAVWLRWGDQVHYEPASYGKPLVCDISGKDVIIVDFSFKREQMEAYGRLARSIVVLDHHKTARDELEPFTVLGCGGLNLGGQLADISGIIDDLHELCATPIVAFFDMEKSGARMAWEFCLEGKPVTQLIRHIEDRDLWRFSISGTAEVSAALRTYPQDFKTWQGFSSDHLFEEGVSILRGHQKNCESMMQNVYEAEVGGVLVPVVNVPYHYASDCADLILKRHPEAKFAAAWFRRGDRMIQYSLRSQDHREDVSEIAKKYGGGGHRNAAGFSVPVEK